MALNRIALVAPAEACANNVMQPNRHTAAKDMIRLVEFHTSEADARTRTEDPFITSEVLYQLSYVGGAGSVYRPSHSPTLAVC